MAANRKAEASRSDLLDLEIEAQGLAARLPALLIEAHRISQALAHGIHGRRRAGPGETFWQFRQFQSNDTHIQIDWRRSASSDRLYVREREWEAAHTIWHWADISPSMNFRSHLAKVTKRDRALVLMFALAELLVDGGERIGLLGLMPPSAQRRITERMAERLIEHEASDAAKDSLPPDVRLSRFSECILLSDFLEPIDVVMARIGALAAQGLRGHLVQILDPAEESLPYDGRVEFLNVESDDRWLASRVEGVREAYHQRLAAHRAAMDELCRRHRWSFLVHHTDRPASEALLTLHARISGEDRRFAGCGRDSEVRS